MERRVAGYWPPVKTYWRHAGPSRRGDREEGERLSSSQRRFLLVLGLPAFGIALAYTVVTTYVPVLLSQFSGPAVTGFLIGAEGALALTIPVLVGTWSDSLRSGIGGRLPFVLAGAALIVPALIVLPLMAGSLLGIAVVLGVFFAAYFVYYAPYYALYPDLVPDQAYGRAQGFQGGLRSGGMLLGLAGGGFLLGLWQPLPFVVGAVAVAGVTALLYFRVRGRVGQVGGGRPTLSGRGRNGFVVDWQMLRDNSSMRNWAVANACWEAAIASLRTFVVLYFTVGLGFSLFGASSALALVGLAAVVAAPISGKLADRYGPRPVMHVAVWGFALGVIPPLVSTNTYFIAAIVPVAFAAVALMTLPYTLLMTLLPEDSQHGAGASLFGLSRGVGVIAGPLLAGLAAEFLVEIDGVPVLTFAETKGYSAIFGVSMLLLLVSIPLLRRVATDDAARS